MPTAFAFALRSARTRSDSTCAALRRSSSALNAATSSVKPRRARLAATPAGVGTQKLGIEHGYPACIFERAAGEKRTASAMRMSSRAHAARPRRRTHVCMKPAAMQDSRAKTRKSSTRCRRTTSDGTAHAARPRRAPRSLRRRSDVSDEPRDAPSQQREHEGFDERRREQRDPYAALRDLPRGLLQRLHVRARGREQRMRSDQERIVGISATCHATTQ